MPIGGLIFSVTDTCGLPSVVQILHKPAGPKATQTLAGITIHPRSLKTGNEENQLTRKAQMLFRGFTDVSDFKDRSDLKSRQARSPGGAIVDIAWASKVNGRWMDPPTQSRLQVFFCRDLLTGAIK